MGEKLLTEQEMTLLKRYLSMENSASIFTMMTWTVIFVSSDIVMTNRQERVSNLFRFRRETFGSMK